jgi:hypothetical protein
MDLSSIRQLVEVCQSHKRHHASPASDSSEGRCQHIIQKIDDVLPVLEAACFGPACTAKSAVEACTLLDILIR